MPEAVPASKTNAFDNIGTELYVQYQRRLRELNAVDFGDLILLVVELFQENARYFRNIRSGLSTYWLTNIKILMLLSIYGLDY